MELKKNKIETDMKEALRSGDKLRLSTLRLLLAAVKNAEIDKRRELNSEELIEAVSRELKKRGESIEEYEKAGREDLASKERAEAEILKGYLPPPLSEEEVGQIIETAITESGASSLKDMGKVMSLVMPQVKGRANGKIVNELVKKKLSEV